MQSFHVDRENMMSIVDCTWLTSFTYLYQALLWKFHFGRLLVKLVVVCYYRGDFTITSDTHTSPSQTTGSSDYGGSDSVHYYCDACKSKRTPGVVYCNTCRKTLCDRHVKVGGNSESLNVC